MTEPVLPVPSDGRGAAGEASLLPPEFERAKSDDIVGIAHQLAQSFVGAWKELISPLDQRVTSGQSTLGSALHVLAQLTAEVRSLREEVVQLRQHGDAMRKESFGTSSKLAAVEERLDGFDASVMRTQAEVSKLSDAQGESEQLLKRRGESLLVLQDSLARSLQGLKSLSERQDSLGQQVAVAVAELSKCTARLQALDDAMQAQVANGTALNNATLRFQERQETIERRIDIQAGAIRTLHANLQDLGGWLEKLRVTLGKVEDVVRMSVARSLPDQL